MEDYCLDHDLHPVFKVQAPFQSVGSMSVMKRSP